MTLAVASAHAEDANVAYIREQVKQTLAGAAQNQNRIDQSEIVDLVNNSNANAKRFNADAVSINNNAQNYLKANRRVMFSNGP
jgi:Holliday junction resolvasome RuvABC endonuclease subunit